jgi:AraC family transcriptional regulator, regulatory protein of adaptative response / DNA-3-methyladenine glycosylase II
MKREATYLSAQPQRRTAAAGGADTAELDPVVCYRALQTRDARFDGRFYIAVVTTRIFCRPICPAPPAKIENCIFLPSAAAAHQMGFRPCLRCRPEVAPGVASWRGSANTISRALQLIAEGGLNETDIEVFAERLGVGARHLRRLFDRYLGASPISVLQTHRLLFAKKLIGETTLTMTDIALAAGYGSIRRFNDAFKKAYGQTPSDLRLRERQKADHGQTLTLKLPFTPPYDWQATIDFLATRAIAGVERVEHDRYCRTFSLDAAQGIVEVRPAPGHSHVLVSISTSNVAALGGVVARVRRLFDLDADIVAIDSHLAAHPLLAASVRERPGVRVPGAWDNFEATLRAMVDQQESKRDLLGRLAAAHGIPLDERGQGAPAEPHLLFPEPRSIAAAKLVDIGFTRARAESLQALSAAMATDPKLLRAYETLTEAIAKLRTLPGIGPWTAQYIAMRALRETDAFPATDPALLRATAARGVRQSPRELLKLAEAWRPWRAYAAMRLWMPGANAASGPGARLRRSGK